MIHKQSEGVEVRSIWGEPHPRVYYFLDRLEATGLPKTLCIIGCADGAEVFPAVDRGFHVLAIDTDEVSLFGGMVRVGENEVSIKGLRHWLQVDNTLDAVDIVHDGFMEMQPDKQYTGVLVSGVIHYQDNQKYEIGDIFSKIKSYVAVGGLVLIEYIHPCERNNDPERYFLTQEQVASGFQSPEWEIVSNEIEIHEDPPNPRNPLPHTITWGKLYASKRLDL